MKTRAIGLWLYRKGLLHLLPWRFLRGYVHPLLLQRKRTAFDGKSYFESWYRSMPDEALSDASTISPTTNPRVARFHYNCVESSILRFFQRREPPAAPRVLDIGSGAGHWIDFFLDVFDAPHVTGLELADNCASLLEERYRDDGRVTILRHDVTRPLPSECGTFQIVNGIGVMFHIVEDAAWERALANLSRVLDPGGYAVFGGAFGLRTNDVQVHGTDTFDRFDDQFARRPVALVNKRVRSRFYWRRAARRSGLRVETVVKTFRDARIVTPENNVIVLRKPL